MSSPVFSIGLVIVLTAFGLITLPPSSFSQAYVSPRGVGSVSVSYQNTYVRNHLFSNGEITLVRPNGEVDALLGQIRFQAVFFDVSYSITDKLAVSGYIPYIAGKFVEDGGDPNNVFGNAHVVTNPDGTKSVPIDDGKYHSGFQDIGLRLRYNVETTPLFITPFIEYNLPSDAYPFYSHAVYGNRVSEFKVGSYFGKLLDPVVPNTYIQGRYAVGLLQKVLDISRTRQHAEIEVGYFLTPSITVTGLLIGYVTHGGLDLPDDYPPASRTTLNPYWLHHIRVSRDSLLDWGIGFQYVVNDRVSLFTGGVRTITGRNMHATDYMINFGINWGFGGSPQRPCHC